MSKAISIEKDSWTCKNPRCFEIITFGSYCMACKKLQLGRKIPDSIICQMCGKEVKVRNLSSNPDRKKRLCDDCFILHNRKRSREYYQSVTRINRLNKLLEGNM